MTPQNQKHKKPSQAETVNVIKEKLHDETENDTIDTDSSDMDPSSEESDLNYAETLLTKSCKYI